MKIKLLIASALLLCSTNVFSQVSLSAGPKVNGLALGATVKQVIAKFGRPISDKLQPRNECTGTRLRTMTYPGLIVELDESEKTYYVFSFTVTSPKYDVSGIRIGAAQTAVANIFGTRGRTIENPRTGPEWYYSMDEEDTAGGTNFIFRRGKLAKITTSYMIC